MIPDTRKWYEKKRFIIPAVLIGGPLLLSGFVGDSSSTESVRKSYIEPVSMPSEEVQQTDSEVTEVQAESEPPAKAEAQTTATVAPEPVGQKCHPSYSGCLRLGAGDYDCAGGSGDGPNYTGGVSVYGYDEFGLDRDGDGSACE